MQGRYGTIPCGPADRLIDRNSECDALVRWWPIVRRSGRASASSSRRGATQPHLALSRKPSCKNLRHCAETSSKVIDVDPDEGVAGSDDGECQHAALLLGVGRQLCGNELDRANVPDGSISARRGRRELPFTLRKRAIPTPESAAPRIADAQAEAGDCNGRQLEGDEREYARQRRPAASAARLTSHDAVRRAFED